MAMYSCLGTILNGQCGKLYTLPKHFTYTMTNCKNVGNEKDIKQFGV